jgi:hypothetical protein
MVNELAPMLENVLFKDPSIASIDVKIPTNAVMPIAMIIAVKNVRSLLPFTDCKATLTFSE